MLPEDSSPKAAPLPDQPTDQPTDEGAEGSSVGTRKPKPLGLNKGSTPGPTGRPSPLKSGARAAKAAERQGSGRGPGAMPPAPPPRASTPRASTPRASTPRDAVRDLPPRKKPADPPRPAQAGKAPLPPRSTPRPGVPGAAGARSGAASVSAPTERVRVSKLMAERGLCSRREADDYISRGWVFVDGERVTELGTRVLPEADISLAREARSTQAERVTLLLHKPVGYVSGQPEPGFEPAVSLIRRETQFTGSGKTRGAGLSRFEPAMLRGLAPAGRLDIDSTGLLVLTQDGRIARQLIGDDSEVEKEYLVRVEGYLDAQGLALLNHGLSLDGHRLRPAKVEPINEDQLRFILREGRKRQIRRMCELVGLRVVGLKRVRIGRVRLGDLPLGQWRFLRPDESF